MSLADPAYAYTLLWKQLQGQQVSPAHAASLLDKYFSSQKTKRKHPL